MSERNYICNLPDELLLKILHHIPPPKPDPETNPHLSWGVQRLPLTDYRSVSSVCQRLNRIANSVMYAHYDHESNYVSSARFIRTLVQNPLLARHLRSLKELESTSPTLQHLEPYKRSISSIECLYALSEQLNPQTSQSIVLTRNILRRKNMFELFQSGQDTTHDLEAALILALAPKIQTVALNYNSNRRRNWAVCLKMMTPGNRSFPYNPEQQFEHLRKLKVNMSGLRFSDISGVLRLPSLVDLILFKFERLPTDVDQINELDWNCPVKESRIRTIRLDQFDIHHSYIVKLISSCHHLEAFALGFSPRTHNPLDYLNIISELEKHHPKLEALSLTRFFRQQTAHFRDVPPRSTSLRGFRNLKYLAAPLELLVNPQTSDPNLHLGCLLPRNLQTFVLSKGEALYDELKRWRDTHAVGTGNNWNFSAEERYNRAFCDKQVQSVVEACRYDNLQLQAFGIHYATDFRYADAPGGYANTSKDLARMEDVHFDFSRFTRDFEITNVHFDYVIKVFHDRTSEAHERLISVRRINGDAVAEDYSYHLHSNFDPAPRYELRGFEQPRFLNTEGEEYRVHRNQIPYELREEI
ncbi:uncharacterized protein CC84DRAFT_809933 [Paraphaeosphaeria sporulosa]|uniref:Uncharacterized protein n=1 Tax=Paraphaeosphaeria sporulosa TaxID=1460663 RepID=A0A177CB97_9PLEO|nr:uncharacterized protein CC84DRAFT_809933 [Paraphaeosphaeria sporulosa]OAG04943.1 hypothetical protein CC84DRAFT_809933 [Paraphaeosphaeria sporulosa]